jgi:Flp pilus assembly pilin Flp
MKRFRTDRGVAAVETAMILGLLLLVAIGSVEWGLGLRDWLSASAGTREGARVGAAAGNEGGADCVILEATAGAIRDIHGAVVQVWIYRSDASGTVGPSQQYRPFVSGDNSAFLRCGTWYLLQSNWPESVRDNQGATRDWIGVRVVFDHDWMTGYGVFSGSICDRGTAVGRDCWTADTVMHLEPDPTP